MVTPTHSKHLGSNGSIGHVAAGRIDREARGVAKLRIPTAVIARCNDDKLCPDMFALLPLRPHE
jgi:hypothetical protein